MQACSGPRGVEEGHTIFCPLTSHPHSDASKLTTLLSLSNLHGQALSISTSSPLPSYNVVNLLDTQMYWAKYIICNTQYNVTSFPTRFKTIYLLTVKLHSHSYHDFCEVKFLVSRPREAEKESLLEISSLSVSRVQGGG